MKNTLAIDVGYGNTKFVAGGDPSKNQFVEGIFRSIARPVHRRASRHANTALDQRDEIVIDVDGAPFAVGPDAHTGASGAMPLHLQYPLTNEYLALTRGAMHYASKLPNSSIGSRIDLLALGLPVSNMGLANRLKERMLGDHWIESGDSGRTSLVTVEQVRVLPQPVGTLLTWASQPGRNRQESGLTLVIDVGYCTFDWFSSLGLKQVPERCGSFAGGISQLLSPIQSALQSDTGIELSLAGVEDGLLTGQVFSMGRCIDFAPYMDIAKSVANEIVNRFAGAFGSGQGYRNILCTGGGAVHFQAALQAIFPGAEIVFLPDPVMANARGFFILGMAM
jgi:plasmid segregation protein ParM